MKHSKDSNSITVLSLISYDYAYLLKSITRYLPFVDEVILGLDAERKSWAGEHVEIPGSFFKQLAAIDTEKKVRIVEEKFHVPGMGTMELDTAERNCLSFEAREGNWIVSIDADEVLLNPKEFFKYIKEQKEPEVCYFGSWIMLFKELAEHYLVVTAQPGDKLETFPIATKARGKFNGARHTEEKRVLSPALALHHSWARTEADLSKKLRNWSHNADFDVESFLNLWRALDAKNYKYLRDFHPVEPKVWRALTVLGKEKIETTELKDLQPPQLVTLADCRAYLKGYAQKILGIQFPRRIW